MKLSKLNKYSDLRSFKQLYGAIKWYHWIHLQVKCVTYSFEKEIQTKKGKTYNIKILTLQTQKYLLLNTLSLTK